MEMGKERVIADPSYAGDDVAFLDIVGDLVEQWGFNRQTGCVWALLYLQNEPLNPSQIQEALGLSAGSINGLLAELQTWGAIKRTRIAGDRHYYFEPQLPIWKPVTNVIRSRELRILGEAQQRMLQLQEEIAARRNDPQKNHRLERLRHMAALLSIAATIGDMLVNAPIERIEKIASFMKRLRNL